MGMDLDWHWGFLAVTQRKDYFTLTSWRLIPPPQKKALDICHLSFISIPCLHLQHWKVFCKLFKMVTYNQGLPTHFCKGKNNTDGVRLHQEPFQYSWPTCPSFVAHQHSKGGLTPLASTKTVYLCHCTPHHVLPTKLSWKTLVKDMVLVSLLWVR